MVDFFVLAALNLKFLCQDLSNQVSLYKQQSLRHHTLEYQFHTKHGGQDAHRD